MPVPEGLARWKISSGLAGVAKMKASQIVGTLAHYRILNKLAPQMLDPPDFSLEELPKDAFKKVEMCEIMWDTLRLNVGHPRKIEKLIYNKEHVYAGSPDLVAPVNEVYTLVDLKTSKEIYESHRLQMGGYYDLLGCAPEQCMLVSMHPDPYSNPHLRAHVVVITKDELEKYRTRFLDLVEKFHAMCLTEKLIKEHGLSFEDKPTIGSD
jgi:hypothetical protein